MSHSHPEENAQGQFRLVALSADVGRALTTHQTPTDMLRICAEAMIAHLDAAFARIWVLDEAENVLVLRASAGMYTHLDGPHARVPVGQLKIGLIAQERRPHLTNSVVGDPHIVDQEWAMREGMVAFAGYPLVVGDRLVGVAALFARHPLPSEALQALGSVADQIAVGIERLHIDAERQMFVSLVENSDEFIGMRDLKDVPFYGNAAAMRMVGIDDFDRYRSTPVAEFFFPEDRDFILREFFPQVRRDGRGEVEIRFRHFVTGKAVWVIYNVFTLIGTMGQPMGLATVSRDITEQKTLEATRERLLAQAQARADREALVNRIGHALRTSLDPELIQETAAALVGEALGADRCYFSIYDPQRDAVRIVRDWHRPNLPSLAGEYRLAEYRGYVDALYANGTAVIADTMGLDVPPAARRVLGGFGIRAFLAVPLFDGGRFAAALATSMESGPRSWTSDEIALMEAVLTQTRTAVEEARLRLREHRIAEQLQAALQPPLPTSVPGLALADYYRPALEDEGVGGDFSDVFSADKGVTFLVVGDLSGKGLAAASQVAMVRQMLRFALYNGRTVAGPVSSLNATLAGNDLLDGFTTLFVGRYDAHVRSLTYVNCGQDAGLVLRASSGTVETLPPTGPVLGALNGVIYAEETVTLEVGDVLALYTDGLTEAGPTRTALLTGDGVADLLKQQSGMTDVGAIVAGVIAGVDAYAGAGVRDDQCLLVGRAMGLEPS